jgi:hypothetical protein
MWPLICYQEYIPDYVVVFRECFTGLPIWKSGGTVERRIEGMVKRLLLLSLLVLALCGVGTMMSFAAGPAPHPGVAPPPPPPVIPPWLCGPAASKYSVKREQIVPIPAQLRKVRVVAPYLAGIAWPRKPLPFLTNPQTWPDKWAPGRYEWLVPVVGIKNEHYWKLKLPFCCKTKKIPRCVYVKANYLRCGGWGPVPVAPPPPMPCKVR